jgi:gluconolactonase
MWWPNPPQIKNLVVWSSMPAHHRRTGARTQWAEANAAGRVLDSFLEGPVFDAEGNLYLTDIPFGRIFRIDPKGQWELIIEYEGEPNGMKFWSAHELMISDYRHGLMLLDVRSAQLRPYLPRRNTESFKGLNDLFIDSARNIYFTDQGQTGLHDPTGRVYRLRPSGQLDLLLNNVPSPNGIVLSRDEKFLFVAATRGNCVWRMPLQSDGGVTKAGQFFTSYGPSGPDGLAVDDAGRLLVANPGLGYVWVLNHRAEPELIFKTTESASITNLAIREQQVFCTNSSTGEVMTGSL